jgi:hypothetical protein
MLVAVLFKHSRVKPARVVNAGRAIGTIVLVGTSVLHRREIFGDSRTGYQNT